MLIFYLNGYPNILEYKGIFFKNPLKNIYDFVNYFSQILKNFIVAPDCGIFSIL